MQWLKYLNKFMDLLKSVICTKVEVPDSPSLYKFSKSSQVQLDTCHPDIQLILNELIKIYDFKVIEGLRTTERQQLLFNEKVTKIDGIKELSKHQAKNGISLAVDIMPVKLKTNAFSGHIKDDARFYTMQGMVKAISLKLYQENKIQHKIRFGLDWDGDDTYRDQTFHDLPHIELI